MLENINRGGCGIAALMIGNALKRDGLTPQFHSESGENALLSGQFEHVVVKVKETDEVFDAYGAVVGFDAEYYTRKKLDEVILRKAVRDRSLWNSRFNRYDLRVLRCCLS